MNSGVTAVMIFIKWSSVIPVRGSSMDSRIRNGMIAMKKKNAVLDA